MPKIERRSSSRFRMAEQRAPEHKMSEEAAPRRAVDLAPSRPAATASHLLHVEPPHEFHGSEQIRHELEQKKSELVEHNDNSKFKLDRKFTANLNELESIESKRQRLPEVTKELGKKFKFGAWGKKAKAERKQLRDEKKTLEEFLSDPKTAAKEKELKEGNELIKSKYDSAEPAAHMSKARQLEAEIQALETKYSKSEFHEAKEKTKAMMETKEGRAIELVRAALKGREVRKTTVMPSEIQAFLEKSFPEGLTGESNDEVDLGHLSKALAREILDFREDPESLSGHGKRIETNETYSFFDEKSGEIESGTGFWIKKSADGKGVEIELIGKTIGTGGYKTVHRSAVIPIDLGSVKHEKTMVDSAFVKQRHAIGKEGGDVFLKGEENVSAFLETLTPEERQGLRLSSALKKTDRTVTRSGLERIEASDELKMGDLLGLLDEKDGVVASDSDKRRIFRDAAKTLELLHKHGKVHADVKPQNIAVTRDAEGKIRGELADFDGFGDEHSDLTVRTKGFNDSSVELTDKVTRLTDIFALAQSVYYEDALGEGEQDERILGAALDLFDHDKKAGELLSAMPEGKREAEVKRRLNDEEFMQPYNKFMDLLANSSDDLANSSDDVEDEEFDV